MNILGGHKDVLELQIEEVNPACEDPGDIGLRHTKTICYVLLQQPKVKADQSEKELPSVVNNVVDPCCCDRRSFVSLGRKPGVKSYFTIIASN